MSDRTSSYDADTVRQLHERVCKELNAVPKFSQEWFDLKEELSRLTTRMEVLDNDANSKRRKSKESDNCYEDDHHGEDDESLDHLMDNQDLGLGAFPTPDKEERPAGGGTFIIHFPPNSQQRANSLIEEQLKLQETEDGDGIFVTAHEKPKPYLDAINPEVAMFDHDDEEYESKNRLYHHKPLEIRSSSAPPYSDDPNSVSTFLEKKRLFPDISKKRSNRINYRSPRFIKIVAASLAAVALIAVSIAVAKKSQHRSSHPAATGGAGGGVDTSQEEVKEVNIYEKPPYTGEAEPNPPPLPEDTMVLFHPPRNKEELDDMREALEQHSDPKVTWEEHNGEGSTRPPDDRYPDFTYTMANHFSTKRTALLFAPGTYYNIDFEVGYYTSVLGLGMRPDDVSFTNMDKGPHVPALEKYTDRAPNGSGLNTFWRSIENVQVHPKEGMRWTVSQAAPLRRMHIRTDLNLFDADSWVSGGYAANMVVDGQVNFGGQQQFVMRNAELKKGAVNGAWSLVYVGCTGQVPSESSGHGEGPSISVEETTTVRVEKPYITLRDYEGPEDGVEDGGDRGRYTFDLRVPAPTFDEDTSGPQFSNWDEDVRPFEGVKLGVPSSAAYQGDAAEENYAALQGALDEGKDLVLSPGIYHLSDSLTVKFDNQVILGLGYATLIAPTSGKPCIAVEPKVAGVRIAGVMLEANTLTPKAKNDLSTLLKWGDMSVRDHGNPLNPGVLTDVFARVGGERRDVSTDVMIHLHSGNVYGDNLWLWRADHTKLNPGEKPNFPHISTEFRQTTWEECEVANGLIVGANANDVTIVGLAVEHAQEDQVIWMGDNGSVYFYQCELPYDADQDYADNEFVGYKVGYPATRHKAVGMGIYSNFRDHDIEVWTGVVTVSRNLGIMLKNIFTVKLDNEGKIRTVVNGGGTGPTISTERGLPHRCSDHTCSEATMTEP